MKLVWDKTGERLYETGVDHGVLYPIQAGGVYSKGVAWNGLSAVSESPSGAEASPIYADNIKYLNLMSAEEFGATVEAYMYPDEFAECDGSVEVVPGMFAGQQSRKTFGLSYRTILGNDVDNNDYGYKLHLIYGALAAPSEKGYSTINDSRNLSPFHGRSARLRWLSTQLSMVRSLSRRHVLLSILLSLTPGSWLSWRRFCTVQSLPPRAVRMALMQDCRCRMRF